VRSVQPQPASLVSPDPPAATRTSQRARGGGGEMFTVLFHTCIKQRWTAGGRPPQMVTVLFHSCIKQRWTAVHWDRCHWKDARLHKRPSRCGAWKLRVFVTCCYLPSGGKPLR
jgi:hypothetical protein